MEKNANKVKCEECGKYFSNVSWHVKVHGLTAEKYKIRHPKAKLVSKEYSEKQRRSTIARYQDKNNNFREKAGKMPFDFVNNKKLRLLLQRDSRSAKVCLKNKLWKPAIILYGSIIEAILVEIIGNKDFKKVIELAFKRKLISEKEYHKIHLVKDLRNFVHIHKELKEKEEINDYWAKTFSDICESIIKRFGK